jgi:hypothetical protein
MRFNTLHDLVQHVETLPVVGKPTTEGTDWAGGSISEAIKLATYGWPEGARIASDKAMRIANRVVEATGAATFQVIEYDMIGAAYDAGAVALGIPEAWGVMAPQVSKRAVHLVLNVSVSGGVPASSIQARGLAVTALVLALQARGYPVTVDVVQPRIRRDIDDNITVRLIDASTGSQLDVDRLTYGLAHSTLFRCLLRSTTNGIRCDGWAPETRPWDVGHVRDLTDPPGDIYLGGAHLSQVDRWQDGGEAWILAEYLKQTGA